MPGGIDPSSQSGAAAFPEGSSLPVLGSMGRSVAPWTISDSATGDKRRTAALSHRGSRSCVGASSSLFQAKGSASVSPTRLVAVGLGKA
jgi:hypothetical protein